MDPFCRRRLRVGFVVMWFAGWVAPSALAADYYADASGGSWTSNSTWRLGSNVGPFPPPGSFPGSAAGDRAIVNQAGIAIALNDFVPNAVTLDVQTSFSVTANAGGSLSLNGTSQIVGGATLNLAGATIANGGTRRRQCRHLVQRHLDRQRIDDTQPGRAALDPGRSATSAGRVAVSMGPAQPRSPAR